MYNAFEILRKLSERLNEIKNKKDASIQILSYQNENIESYENILNALQVKNVCCRMHLFTYRDPYTIHDG